MTRPHKSEYENQEEYNDACEEWYAYLDHIEDEMMYDNFDCGIIPDTTQDMENKDK